MCDTTEKKKNISEKEEEDVARDRTLKQTRTFVSATNEKRGDEGYFFLLMLHHVNYCRIVNLSSIIYK